MTPQEIAENIVSQMPESYSVDTMAEIVAALNLTVAPKPPEGSVKVEIAAGYMPNGEGGNLINLCPVDDYYSIDEAKKDAFGVTDTHRGIITAWIPPVPQPPVVEGTVRG